MVIFCLILNLYIKPGESDCNICYQSTVNFCKRLPCIIHEPKITFHLHTQKIVSINHIWVKVHETDCDSDNSN